MRWIQFLSRLAFICGLFFLLSITLLIEDWVKDESIVSTIITIGFFMGMIVVPVTLLCYLVLWILGKKPGRHVSAWLIVGNCIMFLAFIGYIVYGNYINANTPV